MGNQMGEEALDQVRRYPVYPFSYRVGGQVGARGR